MYFSLAALLCVALVGVQAAAPPKLDCTKMEEVLEDLGGAQGLTTLSDKYKLATNMDEFKKRCSEMDDAIKTLKRYNRECYSQLTQQVFAALLRTRANMNDQRCAPDTDLAKEAVEASKCIAEQAFEEAKDAERKTILASQLIDEANIPDDKMRMRRSCCAVLQSKSLFLEAVKPKCSKYEKVYSEYVDSYTSESMALICEDAEKLKCAELEPLKFAGAQVKSKFFLTPMMRLVKSLDH